MPGVVLWPPRAHSGVHTLAFIHRNAHKELKIKITIQMLQRHYLDRKGLNRYDVIDEPRLAPGEADKGSKTTTET